ATMERLRLAVLPVLALTLASVAIGCSSTDAADVPLYPVPFKAADGHLQVFDGSSFNPIFIKGMNMGVALPGTQAGELSVTVEEYDRWFAMIADLGVNTLRLYTLHFPRFY
ncbi:hypothetical protein, partial [Escherichia coli]|uniref:hypothetical protein n=1 Tax=Escherichia coli TaxID=562 RepID=UPI0018315442